MAKNRLWILLFGLAVVIYGLSQYWQEQRTNRFQSVLLDFVPKEVVRIDIQKAETPPFSIIRNQDRWLLSQQHLNEEAASPAVEDLMQRLRDIRTSALVSQKESEWSTYGLGPQQGILLCLHFLDESQTCIRIGRYFYSEEEKTIQAFIRLDNQKEVFTINGLALSMFGGESSAFRQNQLLALNAPIDSLHFQQFDKTMKVSQTNAGQFVSNHQLIADSLQWANYWQTLQQLQGQTFADDIDELNIDTFRYWQLKIFTTHDSVILDCFRDTSRVDPYLLHSSQFPLTWISSDSNSLHRQLIHPWQKWTNSYD